MPRTNVDRQVRPAHHPAADRARLMVGTRLVALDVDQRQRQAHAVGEPIGDSE
jgi:hypothetical protein